MAKLQSKGFYFREIVLIVRFGLTKHNTNYGSSVKVHTLTLHQVLIDIADPMILYEIEQQSGWLLAKAK